jgi:hypothetical protein
MRTNIIIALCALLGGCATAEAIHVANDVLTYLNHAR